MGIKKEKKLIWPIRLLELENCFESLHEANTLILLKVVP